MEDMWRETFLSYVFAFWAVQPVKWKRDFDTDDYLWYPWYFGGKKISYFGEGNELNNDSLLVTLVLSLFGEGGAVCFSAPWHALSKPALKRLQSA